VTKAFRDAASIFKRKLAVFAKALFAKKLRDTHDKANLTEILRQSNSIKITRCRRLLPRNKENKYAAFIIYISDVYAVQELCLAGLLWNAEIFECEFYDVMLRVRQCF
jgi:hypothetical protein